MNVNEAGLLKRIVDSPDGFHESQPTHAQLPLIARFLRLRWIEKRSSRYYPTRDVQVNLGLAPVNKPAAHGVDEDVAGRQMHGAPSRPGGDVVVPVGGPGPTPSRKIERSRRRRAAKVSP
jgi:hypothetical protein